MMLRFHFMPCGGGVGSLVEWGGVWDGVGYGSVLLPFEVGGVDPFLGAFRGLDVSHSFSFMLALRPFHVSVDFFCMLVRGWNVVAPGRLVVNFLAGHPVLGDVGVDGLGVGGVGGRRLFVRDFVGGVVDCLGVGELPGFVFSGFSDVSVGSARLFGCPVLSMLSDFRREREVFGVGGLNMVCVNVVLRGSVGEAEGVLDGLLLGSGRSFPPGDELGFLVEERRNSFWGDADVVRECLLGLEGEGVTDVLVSVLPGDVGRLGEFHEFMGWVVGG